MPSSEVKAFTDLMNEVMNYKLEINNHKVHWSSHNMVYLFNRLNEEVEEFKDACLFNPSGTIYEAADICNFIMFICDKQNLLKYDRPILKPEFNKLNRILLDMENDALNEISENINVEHNKTVIETVKLIKSKLEIENE
jgi:hypothetical protein